MVIFLFQSNYVLLFDWPASHLDIAIMTGILISTGLSLAMIT